MWRYLLGGAAAAALGGAGIVLLGSDAKTAALLPSRPAVTQQGGTQQAGAQDPLPAAAPEATERTREQKRFDRYDKDRDGRVTRDEYLAQRRKAYAKLDTNGDGRLSFDEWAVKATTKFATADTDKSGAMTAPEFATTAVKRKPAGPRCPPVQAPAEEN